MNDEQRVDDLDVPAEDAAEVKGGIGGESAEAFQGGDPDRPVIVGAVPRKIPSLHKAGDVTLKRG